MTASARTLPRNETRSDTRYYDSGRATARDANRGVHSGEKMYRIIQSVSVSDSPARKSISLSLISFCEIIECP